MTELASRRRRFVRFALVTVASGFAAACGVKGPLYLPEEDETEKKKDKDEDAEKTSRRTAARRARA